MCGIVGYTGPRQALPILLDGLKMLEYRGYDSAGVALAHNGTISTVKCVGKLSGLIGRVAGAQLPGHAGIGHTRWATHGRPSDENAHPQGDCSGRYAVIHNGIIENFLPLREGLVKAGHRFMSQTDTEVIAHLLEEAGDADPLAAIQRVVAKLHGSYALAILDRSAPGKIVAVRKDSPLIVGLGQGENFLASDIPALLEHTRQVYILEDGETAVLTPEAVQVFDGDGNPVAKRVYDVKWDLVQARKGGYPHYMLKEIFDQPRAIRDTLKGRVTDGRVDLGEAGFTPAEAQSLSRLRIVACGTAYHAGLVGKYLIERLARLPVEVDLASEFRYRDPIVGQGDWVLAISQSGETADTRAAMHEAARRGAGTLAITNVVDSSVAREAERVLYTWAGPEIAVASTKAYTTQLVALFLLALGLGRARGTLPEAHEAQLAGELLQLPEAIETILADDTAIRRFAARCAGHDDVFFIGRGLDYAVAQEAQLKLKEISYIHAEAYAAGELKHGTLALVVKDVPVVALATQSDLLDKMVSNITEVKARDAYVLGVGMEGAGDLAKHVDEILLLPKVHPLLAPIAAAVPMQLLAYLAGTGRGCDVDQPRNLAKSVTVE